MSSTELILGCFLLLIVSIFAPMAAMKKYKNQEASKVQNGVTPANQPEQPKISLRGIYSLIGAGTCALGWICIKLNFDIGGSEKVGGIIGLMLIMLGIPFLVVAIFGKRWGGAILSTANNVVSSAAVGISASGIIANNHVKNIMK